MFAFFSCESKKSETNTEVTAWSMNQPSMSETDLKMAVIYQGSTSAYYELSNSYLDHNFQEEFLFYAMIMANKYNYPQAYFDVYFLLTLTYSTDFSIDERTAELALEYLLKAYKKGHNQAKEIVEKYHVKNTVNSKYQIEHIEGRIKH